MVVSHPLDELSQVQTLVIQDSHVGGLWYLIDLGIPPIEDGVNVLWVVVLQGV